ncbi:MAG: MBL fold metallo-hydrolase [Actinobacteria bacterium]|nr:MBL fold metallo-hydrolase [Actinomycetota bacterium]MCA1719663.1 MBL fold metallo-hydrolase [Actinomycetota bacterium]
MQLTVLGCAGTFPGPDSPCSSYLIEHDGFRLVVDLGAGSLGRLQRHIGLLDVDAIYLSHLHADHCIDLVAYSYARRYHPAGMTAPLPVYGPAGTGERICASFETPPQHGLLDVFDFREVPVGTQQIGPFTVTSARTNHPVECHALRLEAGGRSLTYSGDTGVCEPLVELARGTDLFLCEASWEHRDDNPAGVHLSGREAGEHAAKAAAARLLLTHIVAWADGDAIEAEARVAFDGDVARAVCGTTYDV